MKILLLTQYFWPENFRINDLTVGLAEKGHEVVVVTGIPNYPTGKYFTGYGLFKNSRQEYKGVKVLRLPTIPRGRGGYLQIAVSYFSFMISALIFTPFLCRGKFDLIFFSLSPVVEGFPAVVLKALKRASLVFWVQDLWPESLSASKIFQNPCLHSIIRMIVSSIYNSCDKILVQSRSFIAFITKTGISDKKISYFPNFAEDFYQPLELDVDASERKTLPQGFIVMFAGNIGASQDFGTMISAADKLRKYSDIHWVIIGDGRIRKWAQAEVAMRNLSRSFLFLGKHPVEMMPRYFSLADVLLVTLRDEEIFKFTIPSKIQSYLACAKPIIAALAGEGAKVIEESKAGFFCPPENPSALAELVLKMYHMDEHERKVMGLNGRRYFENNFSRSKLINQLDDLLKEIKEARS